MRKLIPLCLLVFLVGCSPGKTFPALTVEQVAAAAASQDAMAPEGFFEDVQWDKTGRFWQDNPPAWANEVPGLLRAYQKTRPPLRNSDKEALGVHIYRYGDRIAMVGLSLLVDRMAPAHAQRNLNTIKAVVIAASGQPEAAAWLDEAFAQSEKLQAQFAAQDHPAAAQGPVQWVPMVQKVFGGVRVAAYSSVDVAAVFVLPE